MVYAICSNTPPSITSSFCVVDYTDALPSSSSSHPSCCGGAKGEVACVWSPCFLTSCLVQARSARSLIASSRIVALLSCWRTHSSSFLSSSFSFMSFLTMLLWRGPVSWRSFSRASMRLSSASILSTVLFFVMCGCCIFTQLALLFNFYKFLLVSCFGSFHFLSILLPFLGRLRLTTSTFPS